MFGWTGFLGVKQPLQTTLSVCCPRATAKCLSLHGALLSSECTDNFIQLTNKVSFEIVWDNMIHFAVVFVIDVKLLLFS